MKTNLDSLFKTSKEVEQEGIWFNISEATGFRVRRFSYENQEIKAALAKYYAPLSHQVRLGTVPPDKEKEILVKVFVQSCLIDWRGVICDEKELPFSSEEAEKLFIRLPELFFTLFEYAKDFKNYREDLGNS